jgi:hypothetical protein
MRFMFIWVWEFAFIASLAVCGSLLPAQDRLPTQSKATQAQSNAGFNPEFREGKQVEGMRGSIRMVQTRYVFFPEKDATRFVLLENLNLERIARAMAETTDDVRWEIDAEVTEFSGSSFLLISRAQLVGN